jgi:hypothetical protein
MISHVEGNKNVSTRKKIGRHFYDYYDRTAAEHDAKKLIKDLRNSNLGMHVRMIVGVNDQGHKRFYIYTRWE